ncbi:MAG: putative phage tail protein, partial [Bacillota bacterium]|nr:putative phage tail protein [Bacillota bacterium]
MENKLGSLIPGFYGDTEEFQALWKTEEKAFQNARGTLNDVYLDTTVLQCSEEVLARWEHALGLESVGALSQRKMVIIAKMRGQGPLSEGKICNMLASFTGGEATAIVSFS